MAGHVIQLQHRATAVGDVAKVEHLRAGRATTTDGHDDAVAAFRNEHVAEFLRRVGGIAARGIENTTPHRHARSVVDAIDDGHRAGVRNAQRAAIDGDAGGTGELAFIE